MSRVEGVEYTPAAVENAREDLILLRDSALSNNHFEWAVLLSHIIAYLGDYKTFLEKVKT